MINIDVSSIAEYIQYCEKLGMKNYWFRGVSKVEYKTLPNIVWRGLRKQESALEHEFLSSYKFYINNHHLDSWEILSLMQHHGLPTRLLDWSESPLVALFFALTSEPDSDDDRVVWVLNPNRLNFLTTGHPNLLCPTNIKLKHIAFVEDQNKHYNIDAYLPPNLKPQEVFNEYPRMPIAIMTTNILKRVSAQKGRFTIHGSEDKSINEYFSEEDDGFQMIKIKITSQEHRKSMINHLSMLGVNEEFIYQDLDSVCDRIKREFNI